MPAAASSAWPKSPADFTSKLALAQRSVDARHASAARAAQGRAPAIGSVDNSVSRMAAEKRPDLHLRYLATPASRRIARDTALDMRAITLTIEGALASSVSNAVRRGSRSATIERASLSAGLSAPVRHAGVPRPIELARCHDVTSRRAQRADPAGHPRRCRRLRRVRHALVRCDVGARDYKLYDPAAMRSTAERLPLVVMRTAARRPDDLRQARG